jgi:hypothetical protein
MKLRHSKPRLLMEVCDQPNVPFILSLCRKPQGTQLIRGWVGPRTGLYAVADWEMFAVTRSLVIQFIHYGCLRAGVPRTCASKKCTQNIGILFIDFI